MKPCPSDVAVREAFFSASIPSHSKDNHLLIAHTLRCFEPENPDIAEVGGEYLTTFGQSLAGDNVHQNPAGLQPAIRVAQESLLCAAIFTRAEGPIVRRIQIAKPEGFDGAMHFQRVALDYVRNPLPGLVSAVGIKFDAVAKHLGATGDYLEGHAIANAGVDR